MKKDPKHKSSVIISFFEDDGSRNWISAKDVRRWLAATEDIKGTTNHCSDDYAIETLLQIRELRISKSVDDLTDWRQPCCDRQAQANCAVVEVDENQAGSSTRQATMAVGRHSAPVQALMKPEKVDAAVQTIPRARLRSAAAKGQPRDVMKEGRQLICGTEHQLQTIPGKGQHIDGDLDMES